MDKLDTLYEVCEAVMEELEKANEKLEKAGGEMSAGDVDYLDKLTHTLKSIKTTIAMMEADGEGYSGEGSSYERGGRGGSSYERGGRGGSSNRSSYARGRGRNARRDSMGRYSREGGSSYERGGRGGSRGGYSRDDAKDEMMEHLNEMRMDAKDEETRRMVDRWIRQIEQD